MFRRIFWKLSRWIIACRPERYFPGKFDFRVDFYRRNSKGKLVSDYMIKAQLRVAHAFEQLHYLLKCQHGATSLEAMIITACFTFIAIIACLAMFSQGGQGPEDIGNAVATVEAEVIATVEAIDWEQEFEDAEEIRQEIEYDICVKCCEVDYNAKVYNVVHFQNCLGNCANGRTQGE